MHIIIQASLKNKMLDTYFVLKIYKNRINKVGIYKNINYTHRWSRLVKGSHCIKKSLPWLTKYILVNMCRREREMEVKDCKNY